MYRKSGIFIASLMVLLFVASGAVHAANKAGDPVAGKDKAAACGSCHGDDGNSLDASFPRLAGQYEGYIVKQIADFKNGSRANNDTMSGMAMMVTSTQDAKDIGAYYAKKKMSKKSLTKVNKKLAAQGEQLFRKGNPKNGVYGCINCHGERGKGKAGNISTFPVIGGQHRDYLIKNLKDFKSGTRANDPANMMADIAKKLSDSEIKAVAEYLSSQL